MPTYMRMGEIARGVFEVLWDRPAGLPLAELRSRVFERVRPSPEEQTPGSNYLGGWTTGLVKARWIRKEDRRWYLTDEGGAAYLRYRDDDPETFAREWVRLYHVAMGSGAAEPRQPRRQPRRAFQPPYVPHADREWKLESAVALARFALASPELYEEHRRLLLSQALWFATEADGKYSTRYRSTGARELVAKDWWRHLRHEHVLTRNELIDAMMLADPLLILQIAS